MKNFKIQTLKVNAIFLLCFTLLATTYSCKEKESNNEDHDYEQNDEQARKEMITHIISIDEATEMYHLYDKQRINVTRGYLQKKYGSKFNDTRTVWLDINTVKEYIKYVEEESKKAGITPTGFQFYFSVYPNTTRGDKKSHQTFFIAPTLKNGTKQSGYTLLNNKKVLLNNYFKKSLNTLNSNMQKGSFIATTVQEDGLLLNRNVPSPPGDNN